MKILRLIMLFGIVSFSIFTKLMAQQVINKQEDSALTTKITSVISPEVQEYKNMFRSYSTPLEVRNEMGKISSTQLKHLAGVIYRAKEKNPIASAIIIEEESKISDSLDFIKSRSHQDVKSFAKPLFTQKLLLDKIKTTLSSTICALLASDYILKVNIIAIGKVKYIPKDVPLGSTVTFQKIEVKAKIEDIIKGSNRFNNEQTITFYYFPFWRPGVKDFEVGETCLVPLNVAAGDGRYDWLALDVRDAMRNGDVDISSYGASFGRFPIIGGKLIDKTNYWGYGEEISYDEYYSKIIQQISIIISW